MSFGKHVLVQYAGDKNATDTFSVEDDMPPLLHAPQTGTNLITGTAQGRIFGKCLAAGFDFAQIFSCLRIAPGAERVLADAQ